MVRRACGLPTTCDTQWMQDLSAPAREAKNESDPGPRHWTVVHVAFAVLAVLILLAPFGALGIRVLLLVIGYNVAVPVVARMTGDHLLWATWCVLAPMSVLMVLPDWFLSAELSVLGFPDTGSPFVGTVPLFMAGMWTVALLPLMLLGVQVESRTGIGTALATVAASGLALFYLAERIAPVVPLWEPVGVPLIGGVATYVIVPEIALCLATYMLVRGARNRPRWQTAGGIIVVPFMYLGMLVSSGQFLG